MTGIRGGAYLNTTRNCFVRFEFNFGYYLHLSKYVKYLHRITTDIYIPMTETKWAWDQLSGIRCQPLTLSYTFCHSVETLAQFDGGFQGIISK